MYRVHHREETDCRRFDLGRAYRRFKDWSADSFVETTVAELKAQLGDDKVILGLSGGVDSSVAAVLLNKAIGSNLTCIFVDHGMLRKNEFRDVMEDYKCLGLNVIGVDASEKFFSDLAGVTDPEQKRKIIGRDFVEVFNAEAKKQTGAKWLAQGTIYPDRIESLNITGKVIKSLFILRKIQLHSTNYGVNCTDHDVNYTNHAMVCTIHAVVCGM